MDYISLLILAPPQKQTNKQTKKKQKKTKQTKNPKNKTKQKQNKKLEKQWKGQNYQETITQPIFWVAVVWYGSL